MPPVPLRDVFLSHERLHEPWQGRVDGALVYSNIESLQPGFGRHMVHDVYPGRACTIAGLDLGRLPPGARVLTAHDAMLLVGDAVIDEQLPPMLRANPPALAAVLAAQRPVTEVDGEVMLGARFGLATWGHWLGELLPRIVVVEHCYPGRFRYALPHHVVHWQNIHPAYQRIHESLLAYGIGEDRILQMRAETDYRFAALHALTSIWSERAIHPQAAELMRRNILLLPPDAPAHPKVALLRTDTRGRNIDNIEVLQPLLAEQGFRFVETSPMPFVQQAAMFRGARAIAAVLGSAMTGLIYAPEGVAVLSLAPESFGDNFFYGLTQERRGRFADLRGPIVALNPQRRDNSSFSVDPAVIQAGLAALLPADSDPPVS